MKRAFFANNRHDRVAIEDRVRMPWRFLARRMAVDGLTGPHI